MFLVHEYQKDRVGTRLLAGAGAVHSQVTLTLPRPFFVIEYLVSDAGGQHRDTVFLSTIEQVVTLMGDRTVQESRLFLLSPGYLNGRGSWAMDEVSEIWVGTPGQPSRQVARYRLANGSELIDALGVDAALCTWDPILRISTGHPRTAARG